MIPVGLEKYESIFESRVDSGTCGIRLTLGLTVTGKGVFGHLVDLLQELERVSTTGSWYTGHRASPGATKRPLFEDGHRNFHTACSILPGEIPIETSAFCSRASAGISHLFGSSENPAVSVYVRREDRWSMEGWVGVATIQGGREENASEWLRGVCRPGSTAC